MDDKYMELYTKLSRLQWLLRRHHVQTHAEHRPTADPTRGQGRVLAILKLQPEIPTKDLAYLLGIRQQSLNELLNKLEKAGFVTREPSKEDRRVMVVKLTEKGRGEQQPQSDFTGVFDCLTQEEQIQLGEYLDRVIAALEAQLTGEDREEIENWMRAARSRMGNEQFERLMASRGGFHPHRDDPRFRDGWWGHGRLGCNPEVRGCGPDGRGPAPDNMPGGERFSPDYDGPLPDGHGPSPHGWDGTRRPGPPPPPPKGPHDPDSE